MHGSSGIFRERVSRLLLIFQSPTCLRRGSKPRGGVTKRDKSYRVPFNQFIQPSTVDNRSTTLATTSFSLYSGFYRENRADVGSIRDRATIVNLKRGSGIKSGSVGQTAKRLFPRLVYVFPLAETATRSATVPIFVQRAAAAGDLNRNSNIPEAIPGQDTWPVEDR